MLSKNILNKLNAQINLEDQSAHMYLAMASWCTSKGYDGTAKFLFAHYHEEVQHMLKLLNYVNTAGEHAHVQNVTGIENNYESLQSVFTQVYNHEKMITKSINDLVATCFEEKDFSSFNFLQWYVGEQHEEEALFKGILDKFEMIGTDGKGIFMIDKEIAKISASH